MPQYANSRGIGYTAWSNGAWSSFMNQYAATPFNTGATSGMGGVTFFGEWSITAPWSGTYTFTIAADDGGSGNMGGNSLTVGGFTTGGNTTSKFFSKDESIVMQWSIGNSPSPPNGISFATNPCAVAWTLEGPGQPPAPSASISVSPNPIIQGQSSTLSWSSSGSYLYSVGVSGVSSPDYSGSVTVTPNDDTQYCITVSGEGGTTTSCTTLTVYIPPNITISASPSTITAGQCSSLSWTTTGDASNIQWLSGGVTNLNLNSSSTVCPSDTITYTAKVSGLGGEDTDSRTITVNQIPTATLTVPDTLLYGQQGTFEYQSQYANTSINLKIYFRDQFGSTLKYDYNLPAATSTQLSAPSSDTIRNGSLNTDIIYNDFGPRYIDYVLTATGGGGVATVTKTTEIIIDETPDNMIVEETEGRFKSENPVFTPNIVPEEVIQSEMYFIEGVDIPVEVKANAPIQIDINKSGNWQNIRQI